MTGLAYLGCDIFDGTIRHQSSALLVQQGDCHGIVADTEIPDDFQPVILSGDLLAPGFVDLQVNGGGGFMFNDTPSVETLRTLVNAHAQFGTTSLLPTLITDTPEKTRKAISAAADAVKANVPGIAGLHLEGPHLSKARKGAHDAALIRPMEDADLELLLNAADILPALMCTIAIEAVSPDQVRQMVNAGITVSIGHSDARYEDVQSYTNAGARSVTHLFNAMSPLSHRAPGLVGAAFDNVHLSAGIIADGIHVHPAALRLAYKAMASRDGLYLVTDAMAPAGTDQQEFVLGGRRVLRRDGRMTLEDGVTLAGADLDMISAVRNASDYLGIPLDDAISMASRIPAKLVGLNEKIGQLAPGCSADFVLLDSACEIVDVYRNGVRSN